MMLKIICIVFISFAVQAAVQSRLWTEGTFPEQSLPSLNKKSNTGIGKASFSRNVVKRFFSPLKSQFCA